MRSGDAFIVEFMDQEFEKSFNVLTVKKLIFGNKFLNNLFMSISKNPVSNKNKNNLNI